MLCKNYYMKKKKLELELNATVVKAEQLMKGFVPIDDNPLPIVIDDIFIWKKKKFPNDVICGLMKTFVAIL